MVRNYITIKYVKWPCNNQRIGFSLKKSIPESDGYSTDIDFKME